MSDENEIPTGAPVDAPVVETPVEGAPAPTEEAAA